MNIKFIQSHLDRVNAELFAAQKETEYITVASCSIKTSRVSTRTELLRLIIDGYGRPCVLFKSHKTVFETEQQAIDCYKEKALSNS